MSEEAIVARKNRMFSGNQDNKDYAATEELHFDDFEAVAKAVLRQQKISAIVSKHLTPQFAEYDKQAKQAKINQAANSASAVIENKTGSQVSIDSDVLDAVVIGLAQLVNSQLRFADEFGLKQDVTFSSDISADIQDMQRRGSSTVLHEWLRGGQANVSAKLDALFEDLAHHQAGILASLDTISRRTIKYLSPELTRKSVHGLAKIGPMWPHYRERNKKLSADQRTRYKLIIAPGVAYGYTKAKKKIKNKFRK